MDEFLKQQRLRIIDQSQIEAAVARWSLLQKKVVFTNGCFDLIHPGHIHTLSAAKSFGDVLIIGLNSDASVKRLKGENRPIKNEYSRALLLASLSMVDAVVLFEDEMKSWGGEIQIVPFLDGHSSTALINKT